MRLENAWQDQRPSSRITPDPSDSQLHDSASSVHLTHLLQGSGQRTGMDIAEAWFCAQWPIFVLFLRFVFGLLSGWKIQTWPIIRFLTESVTYWFFYLLVFDRIHDAMYLNKMLRTSSRNIGPQHQKYSSIFHCTHGVLFIPVFTKPILSVCCYKANFLFSSDNRSQSYLKFQSCLITEYTVVCFWMSKENFSWNPLKQHVVMYAVWHFF